MFWLMGGKAFILALAALGAPVTGFIAYQSIIRRGKGCATTT